MAVKTTPALENDESEFSLTDLAYAKIRARILDKEIHVGRLLSVVSLAEELGMSRSPVRAALERLLSERILRRSKAGLVVAKLGMADLLDAIAVREPLEGLAAALAAPMIDSEAAERLQELHIRFKAAVESSDESAALRLDIAFHAEIQKLSGNAYLIDALERVQTQVVLAVYATSSRPGRDQAIIEHAEVLEALVRQDGAAARVAAQRHLHNVGERTFHEWKHSTRIPMEREQGRESITG